MLQTLIYILLHSIVYYIFIKMILTRKRNTKKVVYQEEDSEEQISTNIYSPKMKSINKKKRNKKSETKNIVLNYRTIIRKIINQILTPDLECALREEINQTLIFMEENTNLDMLRQCLKKQWLRQIMLQSHQSGRLMISILESSMYIENKLYCIKYFNKLLNGIMNPQGLIRWKPLLNDTSSESLRIYQKKQIQYQQKITNDKGEPSIILHDQEYSQGFEQYEMTLQRYQKQLYLRLNPSDPDLSFSFV